MKTLYFEQITDDRFDEDIHTLLENRVKKIKELLAIDGVTVTTGDISNVDFGTNKQCRCKFYVTKKSNSVTWTDIFKLVNSVKAVPYRFE